MRPTRRRISLDEAGMTGERRTAVQTKRFG
jgi:hypothetical protein